MNQLINEPSQGSKNVWVIAAVAIITALVVGGEVYKLQKSAIENEKNETAETVREEFQQEIVDLKTQLSQLKETQEAVVIKTPVDEEVKPAEPKEPAVEPPVDPTADWNTYKNKTFGYSIKYPNNWVVKRGYKVFETAASESILDMNIGINDENGNNKIKITTDSKRKMPGYTLSQYASHITPLDKVTIVSKESYIVGDSNGYKELVTISDPYFRGLCYFTQDKNYFYSFFTKETTQSSEVVGVLKSFRSAY